MSTVGFVCLATGSGDHAEARRSAASGAIVDLCGARLSSAGESDIALTIMKHAWEVAYLPELNLIHLIPSLRLTAGEPAGQHWPSSSSRSQPMNHSARPDPAGRMRSGRLGAP